MARDLTGCHWDSPRRAAPPQVSLKRRTLPGTVRVEALAFAHHAVHQTNFRELGIIPRLPSQAESGRAFSFSITFPVCKKGSDLAQPTRGVCARFERGV